MRLDVEIAVYRLAQDIEAVRAKSEWRGERTRGSPQLTWEHFYDPHAAHLLGELILSRISPAYRGRPATAQSESRTDTDKTRDESGSAQ